MGTAASALFRADTNDAGDAATAEMPEASTDAAEEDLATTEKATTAPPEEAGGDPRSRRDAAAQLNTDRRPAGEEGDTPVTVMAEADVPSDGARAAAKAACDAESSDDGGTPLSVAELETV